MSEYFEDNETKAIALAEDRVPLPGRLFEGYRVLEKIGEGGMGSVYLAERRLSDPVTPNEADLSTALPRPQKFAIKVVRSHLPTAEMLARFELEHQALTLLDHPGIAKVYEMGTTQDQRPFFVMEYVPGLPVTEYADAHQLSPQDRLDLFGQVAEAIQHAHLRGIIHRDLKPSNVLVSTVGGKPIVKVIDFGVAKTTLGRLTDRTLHTAMGQILGTPDYMSPEQANSFDGDVDLRTDLYSLGMILYELLVGESPFDREAFRSLPFSEVQKFLREVDPVKPSTRLSSLGERSVELAGRRSIEVKALAKALSGDLDCIVMKCLEKDRNRRYGSAQALIDDLERYASDEPISARPPGPTYRLAKFVQKHRTLVAATVLFFCSIVTGLAAGLVISLAMIDELQTEKIQTEEELHESQERLVVVETDRNSLLNQSLEFRGQLEQVVDAASTLSSGPSEFEPTRSLEVLLENRLALHGEQDPHQVPLILRLARAAIADGDWARSEKYLGKLVAFDGSHLEKAGVASSPTLVWANTALCEVLHQQNRTVEARKCFQVALGHLAESCAIARIEADKSQSKVAETSASLPTPNGQVLPAPHSFESPRVQRISTESRVSKPDAASAPIHRQLRSKGHVLTAEIIPVSGLAPNTTLTLCTSLPSGEFAAVCTDRSIRIIDPNLGKTESRFVSEESKVTALGGFDAERLYLGFESGDLYSFPTNSTIDLPGDSAVSQIMASRRDLRVVHQAGTLSLVDPDRESVQHSIELGIHPLSVDWSGDGQIGLVTTSDSLQLIKLKEGACGASLRPMFGKWQIGFLVGRRLVRGVGDTVEAFDLKTGCRVGGRRITGHELSTYNPAEKLIVFRTQSDFEHSSATLLIYDLKDRNLTPYYYQPRKMERAPIAIRRGPREAEFYLLSRDGQLVRLQSRLNHAPRQG